MSSQFEVEWVVNWTKRLRSSSGHGVDWRTGWTSSAPGHLHTTTNFCRSHGNVTKMGDPEYHFCDLSVFLPTSLDVL